MKNKETNRRAQRILSMSWLFLFLVSCAEKRPVQIAQTSAHNLLEISDFQGKEYELQTKGSVHSGSSFTNAKKVTVSKAAKGVNNFGLVGYETTSPHLEGVSFFGKTETTYKLKYEVTSDYLVVSKISKKEDLPFQELTYATSIGEDTYKVPMVGYPVTLYKLVRRRNHNNELTHNLDKVRVYSLKEATHLDINFRGRREFNAISKNNVFKANFFEGEWFYAATVVSASPDQANSIGRDLSMDFKARSVSRIRFVKRFNNLTSLNLNVDDNLDVSDDINLEDTVDIPSVYFDYRQDKIGESPLLKEIAIGNDHKERRLFDKRDYIKLNFASVNSALTRRGHLNKVGAILDSLEIDGNYFSFVVYYPSDEVKIRYAFRKAHKPREGRIYFKPDRKIFGFFSARRDAVLNHRYEREDAQDKLNMLNRFYPKDGKIVYYFSKQTPEHMKEVARESIRVWDEAFQKAGTGIRIVLNESRAIDLGDIRHNIINIIDTKNGGNLLGYGPSVVDSLSGEIISASANIYVDPFREIWIAHLRNYIRSELKMFDRASLGVPVLGKMEGDQGGTDQFVNSMLLSSLQSGDRHGDQHGDQHLDLTAEKIGKIKALVDKEMGTAKKMPSLEGMFHNSPFNSSHKDVVEQIKSKCGASIDSYIQELKRLKVTHTGKELKVLGSCTDILLHDSIVSTIIHELGHNFGLRHNFKASVDAENFLVDSQGKVTLETSSVMDYSSTVSGLTKPGAYDIAAIRFGYGNSVLLKNGSTEPISIKESLKKQIAEKSLDVVKYKFCTDEDVQVVDPLCQRHDAGVNPKEIVEDIIRDFYSSYVVHGNRYDRAKGLQSGRFSLIHLQRTLLPLKNIYDQWRFYLREFVGAREQYLENFSPEEFKAVLDKMKNSPGRYGKFYSDYYEASELIYDFFKKIIFSPSKLCVGTMSSSSKKDVRFISFKEVKEAVFKAKGVTIDSCSHAAAIDIFKSKGLSHRGEFGFFHGDQRKTLDISDEDYDVVDTVGFEDLRYLAFIVLAQRESMMGHLRVNQFNPNLLDNPFHREEIVKMALERVLDGIDGKDFGFEGSKWSGLVFSKEKVLLKDMFLTIVRGLGVPGNFEESNRRALLFTPNVTADPREVPKGALVIKYRHVYIFTTAASGTPVRIFIKKREELVASLAGIDASIPELSEQAGSKTYKALQDAGQLKTAIELREKFLVKDVISYVASLGEFIQTASQEQAEVVTVVRTHFSVMFELFGRVPEGFDQSPEGKVILNKSLKTFLSEIDRGISFEQFVELYSEESLKEAIKRIIQAISVERNKRSELGPYMEELEAQRDIITEILIGL